MSELNYGETIISVKDMVKTFQTGKGVKKKEVKALRNVSFDLKKGRAMALVGESGSGKSTVARLLTKMHQHTSGEVFFKGEDINQINSRKQLMEYRKQIQMIFQDPYGSLNPAHTIYHHIARPLLTHNHVKNSAEAKVRVNELLQMVELDPELTVSKFPHQLSGGQRQRVSIARAVAVGAEVILADEPTSMLDVSIRLDVLDLLKRLKDEQGFTFLYITHDIATARYFAEEIAIMYQGQIVEFGDTGSVIDNPQHPYTQLLLSAIPNPYISFEEAAESGAELLAKANVIREASFAPVTGYKQFDHNHYVGDIEMV
ncbi:ABC transporter ATP-binding protein [uncultured Vibrio sp.]|uniref:ABC transporter ATP-binding protein n=1 Tax=uncultured Vibrio sp. TaxID=114054 RepID=UPI00091856F9|nr:ATP-binding cassette domain-containing protein [uncultured Vibrio sp.]OIQ24772.1 MAG: dipeptide/oligopeptide/nickel ABC transporter ATP-binding protein [Vibrio sp. MedPE-SWchi]